MTQAVRNQVVNTFVKGLITEASPLTFPPDASIDELNCTLNRDGSRRRRLGIETEAGSSFLTGASETSSVFIGTWENVANDSSLTFLVIQLGNKLRFVDKAGNPLGDTLKSFNVSLKNYLAGNGVSLTRQGVGLASLNGTLYVVHPAINPISVSYDADTDDITVTELSLQTRDFEWQGDSSLYDQEQVILTDPLKYDYYNIGWDDTKLSTYYASRSAYPPLNLPWFAGKDASNNFSVTEYLKIYAGNTLTANGHFILDFFDKDRSTVSGIAGITNTVEKGRPQAVAAYAGRVFYAGFSSSAGRGLILFSQTIESSQQAGRCYQAADPTSEQVSDLIATDGGVINIPDANNIKLLFVVGHSLMVFAENGVWAISGRDGVFSASDYFVSKVTSVGIDSITSFIDADGIPVWWSQTGIHTVQQDNVSQNFGEQNLSISTIQTFFNDIGKESRANVVGAFDATNKKIYWVYPDVAEVYPSKRTKVLLLDLLLQAFYPWEFAEASDTTFVIAPFYYRGVGVTTEQDSVVVDDDPVTVGGDGVVITLDAPDYDNVSDIRFLMYDGTGLNAARLTNDGFVDWGSADYSSFAEAGYDFAGSMGTRKNAPIVTVYLGITEEGFSGDDLSGYALVRPSSCLMSVYWDLRTSPSTSPKEVYRFTRPIIVDSASPTVFSYPYQTLVTRNGVRGRGRSMRVRFSSSAGKDFHLIGYEVIQALNRNI